MFNLRKIRAIRKYLTSEACQTLILTLVMSHLDYSNSILIGLPEKTIKPYQRIQNISAKLVLNMNKFDSSKQALRELNWLPIRARVEYKVLCLVHKCLFDTHSPQYLKNLLVMLPTPARQLRSSINIHNKLLIPLVKRKTFAERSFSISGPRYWNALPMNLRAMGVLETFKSHLKTYLFAKYLS